MASIGNFDANEVEPAGIFDALKAGKYIAAIVESDMKATKDGTGKYLELKFQIVEGEFKGRTVFARLNLENKNDVAVKIARSELSSICRAVNVMAPKDSVDLHNIPLSIKLNCKADGTGEMRNEIKGYEKRDTALQAVPTDNSKKAAPWAKKA